MMTSSGVDRLRELGLGTIFVAWLYGVPFLLIVALARRVATPYTPTYAAARAFGTRTDTLLIAALVLNAVLPLLGLILARFAGKPGWRWHFAGAVAAMFVIYLAIGTMSSTATGSLIGHTPKDLEQRPPATTHCVPVSGGRGCPGG